MNLYFSFVIINSLHFSNEFSIVVAAFYSFFLLAPSQSILLCFSRRSWSNGRYKATRDRADQMNHAFIHKCRLWFDSASSLSVQ